MTDTTVPLDTRFERALSIVRAINDRCFFAMGISETVGSLEGVSLADMLEAKRLVEQRNENAAYVDGKRTINVVPDDRLIAAAYTLEHYRPDNEAIAVVPTREWPFDRRALGVVGLEPAKQDQEVGDNE